MKKYSNLYPNTPTYLTINGHLPLYVILNKKIQFGEIVNAQTKHQFPKTFIHLLLYVRNLAKEAFHAIEGKPSIAVKPWSATSTPEKSISGGGMMSVLRGEVLEKSAVNMSVVWGPHYPSLETEHAGKPFLAGGVSLISHPKNPHAPIMRLNIRCLQIFHENKTVCWIGGGADLTPMIEFNQDTLEFHAAMKNACERNPQIATYDLFKKQADDYFFIPHRKEARGVGGIFFDHLMPQTWSDFALLLDVGQFAIHSYTNILARRVAQPFTDELREKHLYWRGRYAEFNLVYDKGTRFGLMTGGNHEAIFCSLPPLLKW